MQENLPVSNTPTIHPEISTSASQPVYEKPKTNNFLIGLLSVLLILTTLMVGYFAYQTQQLVKELQMMGNDSKQATETLELPVEATSESVSELNLINECRDNSLNISIKYPSGWSCDNDPSDEWIILTSSSVKIHISTLGRGPFCGGGPPDPNESCVVSDYYSSSKFDLSLYTSQDQDRELFGGYNFGSKPWISVVDNTISQLSVVNLDSKEKIEVLDILNSAESTN